MRVRLAFQQAVDERFLVTWESLRGSFTGGQGSFFVVAFDDENDFIQQVVLADLKHEDTVSIIAGVLLTLANRGLVDHWVPLTLTPQQLLRLRLKSMVELRDNAPASREFADLHDVMMQTPTPFIVMSGPDHRITFINPAYAQIMQRESPESVLGKTIREALPELVGQPFFRLLDEVYRAGTEHVGREIPAQLRNIRTGALEKHYFDFIYYPVRDSRGEVCGIMAQATDITVEVLIRQVSASREEQLYKQWAELDTIYRYSPMAMSLIDAKEFRLLRVNDLTAEQLCTSAEDLIGKRIADLLPEAPELLTLYARVLKGEIIRNHELVIELPPGSGVNRTWLLTLSPLYGEGGHVEMIESVAVEITERLVGRCSVEEHQVLLGKP